MSFLFRACRKSAGSLPFHHVLRVRQGSQDLPELQVLQPRVRTGTARKRSTRWSRTRTGPTSALFFLFGSPPPAQKAPPGLMLQSRQSERWTSFSEMTPDPVAFLDSGVGGLPYLAHARKHLRGQRFVYVADRENFPYGEKSRPEIIEAALAVAGRLIEREHPRLVVVACNTMSVVALAELRARFHVPFVGVVPAVKPAASLSRKKRVGVLATRQTVEGDYLRNLIGQHASGCAGGEPVLFRARGFRGERTLHGGRRGTGGAGETGSGPVPLGRNRCPGPGLHPFPPPGRRSSGPCCEAEAIALVDSREGVTRQAARLHQ